MNFYLSSNSYINTLTGPKLVSKLTCDDQIFIYKDNVRLQKPSSVLNLQDNKFYDTQHLKSAFTALAIRAKDNDIYIKTEDSKDKLENLAIGSFIYRDEVNIATSIDEFDFVKGLLLRELLVNKKLRFKHNYKFKREFVEKVLKKNNILFSRYDNKIEVSKGSTDPDLLNLRKISDKRLLLHRISKMPHQKMIGMLLGYFLNDAKTIFENDENFLSFKLNRNYFFDNCFTLLPYILDNYIVIGNEVLLLENKILDNSVIKSFMKFTELSTQKAASNIVLETSKKYYRNLSYLEIDMKADEFININNILINFK